ncbi:NACHT and WD40 repeat domain-containing protein, partial [Mycoavidus cysteinexigens]
MFTPASGLFSSSNPVAQGQRAPQTPKQLLEQVQHYKKAADWYKREGQVVEAGNHYKVAQNLLEEVLEKSFVDRQTVRMFGLIYSEYSGLLKALGRTAEAAILDQKEQTLFERYSASSASSRKREVERGSSSEHLNKKNHPVAIERLAGVETLVQNCQGTINAPVHGKNNTVNVHYYSANPELLPQIQEIHTSVGELKSAYLDRFIEQQARELCSKKEPLAILGQNIEAEYFTAWEEPGEIQDGLAMYVAPQAATLTDKNTLFDLDEAVTAFLTQAQDSSQKTQVLLLRGEAGSGKSTFNRHLARRLWRDYSAASGERPIPLYISLPTIDKPNKNLIGQYLSDKYGFSPEQIDALRASQRFIFILDGYDEIPAEQRNLYADEKLDQWQAKILLSCRPEYLTEGYQNHLQPRGRSRVLLEYQLALFSEQSIETYIHQYVKHMQAQWSAEDYQDRLARIPNVKELLGTPFLLKMALSVLPTLDEARPGQVALTRIKLYEQFVQTWFKRSLERLDAIQSKLTETQKSAFYGLKEEGFIKHSETFNTDFALALSEAKTTVAAYSPLTRRGIPQDKRYEAFLSNQDEGKKLLRFSALLTCQQQQYRFIHKSIQDYLVARAVWEELENFTELASSDHFTPLNWVGKVRVLWEALSPSVEVDAEALLNTFNVVEDVAIQRFLVERVQQNGGLLKPLLAWIKASTSQDSVSMAAANAITILVKAGVQFNAADLKGVQIPGADLSFGVFDSAQLQGADLSEVNFRNSWLRHADLSAAKMAGVRFGEWAYLEEESYVYSCAYSPDGENCAVGLWNGTISIYSTSNWEKSYTLEGHTSGVTSVVYSPSGSQIASGSEDKTVRVWDAHSGAAGHTLAGHTDSVFSVVYSPNGEQIASGSDDWTVRLWDAESGAAGHILEGHTDWVRSVVYSPSGSQIASGSGDKTVRLWDAHSGAAGHTLEGHTASVLSVVYSPSGSQIASGSEDKTVRLWDATSGAPGFTLTGHTDWVKSVVYSPSGSQIASGSDDRTVRLWDAESGAAEHTLEGHTSAVWSVVYSPNGSQIASGSKDETVRLWDT